MAEPLFARTTSGLVRAFGAWDVFVFNVLGYSLGLVLTVTPVFLEQQRLGVSIHFVLLVGLAASLVSGLTYACLSASMPRTGGDYVFISRALGVGTGFIANWGFTCSQVFGIGVYTYWCVTTVMSPGLFLVADASDSHRLLEIAKLLAGPSVATTVIGILLFAIVILVSLLGLRGIKWILNWLFLLAVAGLIVLGYVLFSTTHDTALRSFEQFTSRCGGAVDILQQIPPITQETAGDSRSLLFRVYETLPLGYWIFLGFTYSVYVGGEIRRAKTSQIIGITGSILFGFAVYWLLLSRYYEVFGTEFIRGLSIIGIDAPAKLPAGNGVMAIGGALTQSVIARTILALSFFLWYFLLLIIMMQICIRNLFAWAMDRIISPKITAVTSRNAAPWVASLIVGVAALSVFLIHAWRQTAFVNYIALFSVCNLIAGLAAVTIAFRRTDLLERSPEFFRSRILRIPVLAYFGAANAIMFALILMAALTQPDFSGVTPGATPTVVVIVAYSIAAGWYSLRKRRGALDTRVLSYTLPPE
jgi:amino acid transporter